MLGVGRLVPCVGATLLKFVAGLLSIAVATMPPYHARIICRVDRWCDIAALLTVVTATVLLVNMSLIVLALLAATTSEHVVSVTVSCYVMIFITLVNAVIMVAMILCHAADRIVVHAACAVHVV